MFQLTQAVTIEASPEKVWGVLTDLPRYAEWNPWIYEARGGTGVGDLVFVSVRLGSKSVRARHRVLTSKPMAEFRWCDLGAAALFAYGERARFLEPAAGGGVAYRVELRVKGVASSVVKALYGAALAGGLEGETLALKRRCESPS
jgi:hypothetical protein